MTAESTLLVGRDTDDTTEVFETHAERVAERTDIDDVVVATDENNPGRELREPFEHVTAETVYVVPVCTAHTHDTLDGVPAATDGKGTGD